MRGKDTDAERGSGQLINVWMEDLVHETDGGRFVGVLVGQLNVDLPLASGEGCYKNVSIRPSKQNGFCRMTVSGGTDFLTGP